MSNHSETLDELVSFPNGTVVLQNKFFSSTHQVIHATSTRLGGYSSGEYNAMNLGLSTGDDPLIVGKNREKFFKTMSIILEEVVYAQQTHSNNVAIVDTKLIESFSKDNIRRIANTDALVTGSKNIPLAVLTADCLPIFILDRATPAIGLVHAGWRGTKSHIVFETVQAMKKCYNSKTESMSAWISAGIHVCCYQVSDDLRKEFSEEYGDHISAVEGDKLNLVEVNRIQLQNAGIPIASIFSTPYCTQHDKELFYSHRRDGKKSGRMASVFMLR